MNRRLTSVLAAVAVAGVTPVALTHSSASAVEDSGTPAAAAVKQKVDDKPDALNTKRRELKTNAATAVATGEKQTVTKNGSEVVKMGSGKNTRWVEHEPTEKSQLLSFLVEFGDGGNPAFPDNTSGPLHNEIAPPAEDDNSTYWEPDFSREHFMDMFFTTGGPGRGVVPQRLQGDVERPLRPPGRRQRLGDRAERGVLRPDASRRRD